LEPAGIYATNLEFATDRRVVQTDAYGNKRYDRPQYKVEGGKVFVGVSRASSGAGAGDRPSDRSQIAGSGDRSPDLASSYSRNAVCGQYLTTHGAS
jgi:hypothetical protein